MLLFFLYYVYRILTAYSYTSSAIIGSMYLSATEKKNKLEINIKFELDLVKLNLVVKFNDLHVTINFKC